MGLEREQLITTKPGQSGQVLSKTKQLKGGRMKILKYRVTHHDLPKKEWFVSFSGKRNRDEVLTKFRTIYGVITSDNDSFNVELWDTISDPFDNRLDDDGRNEAIKHAGVEV